MNLAARAAISLLVAAALGGCAEFKGAGRQIGHDSRDAGREIAKGTKEIGREVAKGTKKLGHEIATGAKQAARSVRDAVRGEKGY